MTMLTERQERVLDFIRSFLASKGFPPTHAEISEGLGFRSANAAKEHLILLAKKGVVALSPGVSRGLRVVALKKASKPARPPHGAARAERAAATLPLIGQVAAGQPILAVGNIEREVPLDPAFFRPRADYLLRVRGDSMIDAGIFPGDLVAVHKTPRARDGQIAVVRLDDEVTVKRWSTTTRNGAPHVVLEPANAALRSLVVDPRRTLIAIEGLVVGLLRTAAT